MLLADAGARIIKVEDPRGGDPYRREGPNLVSLDGSTTSGGFIVRFNRTKESVAINLKDPDGVALFKRLAATADVLVENFSPGTMLALGLDYGVMSTVSPTLIYTSISGFGQIDMLPSPYAHLPALAVVAEAMGGVMDRIGDASCPPHWSGVSLGDLYAGSMALSGILIALAQRAKTGVGQHVDVAMVDCMISLNERGVFSYAATGQAPLRGSNPDLAPFGPFKAKDGWIVIGVIGNPMWYRFCRALGRPDLAADERLSTGLGRGRHLTDVIEPAIRRWLEHRSREEATEILHDHKIPSAPVATAPDVTNSPHTAARQMLVDVDYPGFGSHKVVGTPIKLSGDPNPRVGPIPVLGQHTKEVLTTLAGVQQADYSDLVSRGVVLEGQSIG
jgi:formyl-CoA transferase